MLPNYPELVKFLVSPLLDDPSLLLVDAESTLNNQRIWLRVSFAAGDKGKVFGRGGRTIQAIRYILEAAARTHNQQVHMEIFE
ncbi:KH domain-containing protein [Candidatus Cyanaurora vandensis]|uniref:KH domain-containing protein n=1 Tax=Candidatus Cyanaurora vandensis TaxID=2714958 RepID=UPI00257C78E4|nr:KH domain-containing protein [Candidatus Cyanaurora vandensis]